MNIFKYAAAHKLRFPYKGSISVEDLYDLSIENLDLVYRNLKRQQKDSVEDSLIQSASSGEDELAIRIEIVREIYSDKVAEIEARRTAAENKARKQRILSVIAAKQQADLEKLSVEELMAQLEALEASQGDGSQ